MKKLIALTILMMPGIAQAGDWELISEIAVGWRIDSLSDRVTNADCIRIQVVTPATGVYDDCGGHAFIYAGYPLALTKATKWGRIKVGWLHYSSYFDGKNSVLGSLESGENGDAEVDFNCLCGSYEINWSRLR